VAEGLHRLALLELPRAQACFVEAERYARAAGEPQTMIGTASRAQYARWLQGDVSAGLHELPELIERSVALGIWSEASFAAAQLGYLRTLAGRTDAVAAIDQAQRWHRRSDYTWSGLIAGQAAAALAAREGRAVEAVEAAATAKPSFVEALAAVERHDVERVRAVAGGARWRSGLRGRLTVDTMAIAVALIEVGDLLDEPALVGGAAASLTEVFERGVLVAVGWPALVPRLLAAAARVNGELDRADRLVEHGRGLAERHDLRGERARLRLERARLEAAKGAPADEVRDRLAAALTAFDELGHHGWVARTESVAGGLGIALLASTEGTTRDRTIFTTDVVGSTAANARLGDALYLEQLRVHDRLVRARLREWRGIEIKHTGDGINASFDDPVDAVRCVLALCNDIRGWQRDAPDRALELRYALAKGRLIASEGDYFGLVQSEAARLCARAQPGEVLVTGALAHSLPDGVGRLDPRGIHELRGLPEPVEILALAE
jgi:class 3 adenylate cyclase